MKSISVNESASLVESEWKRLLLVSKTNGDDNFFVLGGDSMLGTMLMLSLMDAIGIELSLSDLYENPTIQELTALVISKLSQGTE